MFPCQSIPLPDPLRTIKRLFLASCLLLTALWCAAAALPGEPEVRVVERFQAKVCHGGYCQMHNFEWRQSDDARRIYLYRDGVQVGGFDFKFRVWMDYDARSKRWGQPQDCAPYPVPHSDAPAASFGQIVQHKTPAQTEEVGPQLPEEKPIKNFGIDLQGLHAEQVRCAGKHCYSLNGHDISRGEALAAIGGDVAGIPNDADCLRLTWVGSSDAAAKIQSSLAEWSSKVCFQSYASTDDPVLKGLGFTTGLQVQAPDGKPLWYCADVPDSETLNKGLMVADARRKDPKWDPLKWPNLAVGEAPKPDSSPADPTSPLNNQWVILAIAGAIVVAAVMWKKRN